MRKNTFKKIIIALAFIFIPSLLFAGCFGEYKVNYVTTGGSEISQAKASWGKVTKPADPIREDYTFAGWYTDEELTKPFNFDKDKISKETTLYAKWVKIEKYTVYFEPNGGSYVSRLIVPAGKITPPTAPTREGYTFNGWFKDTALKNEFDFEKDEIVKDTILYASWVKLPVVSFNSNGGSEVKDLIVNFDEPFTAPSDPTKTNNEFMGWYKDESLETPFDFGTDSVNEDTTLYAKWSTYEEFYKLTYQTNTEMGGGMKITGTSSTLSEIKIPGNINGYVVTSIDTMAFYMNKTLTSVIIEDGVHVIGTGAFGDCQNLTSVSLPESLEEICDGAFTNTGLTSINIPRFVTSIGVSAFSNCPLETITVAEMNTTYDSRSNCNALIETATSRLIQGCKNTIIVDGVDSIITGAFSNVKGLISVTIPKSVTYIAPGAFTGVTDLTEIIVDSENTVYDSRENCNAIIQTSNNMLVVGCVTTIIPQSVTGIEEYAFALQTGLTTLSISSGITHIGDFAFAGCENITRITIDIANEYYETRGTVAIIEKETNRIIFGNSHTTMPSTITVIGSGSFCGISDLTEITIPTLVTIIEEDAFSYSGLTSVTIPSNVLTVGSGAFAGSMALATVIIEEGVTVIGDNAFTGCYAIKNITFPSSLTELNPIVEMRALETITLKCDVQSIAGGFFEALPETITAIYVPAEYLEAYTEAVPENLKDKLAEIK